MKDSREELTMSQLIGACVFGQSGGPTSVINASFYGAVKAALDSESITKVYGAAHGIQGILNDVLYDMGEEDPKELKRLMNTPSSALGSCRYKLADPDKDDTDFKRILEIFRKYDIRYFFYNGGNDSMDTCEKVSRYMSRAGWECRVMGIPKTIDNDLFGTDHCPGFGSAAKYIATSCMEIALDAAVYDYPTATVVEIMGRHAGWLAGSAALASRFGSGPDLIYLPEDYATSGRYYPTVYLLHQFNSDHTAYRTDRVNELLDDGIARGLFDGMIVVIPNSDENSWWTGHWEKMITEELIPLIDSRYRTIDDPRFRLTAGCSMGGQGAYGVALRNPNFFGGAVSFFGAFSYGGASSPNAIAAAEDIGIRRDRAVKYVSDPEGTELNYRVVSDTLCDLRMSRPVTASWKAAIEADEQARGN